MPSLLLLIAPFPSYCSYFMLYSKPPYNSVAFNNKDLLFLTILWVRTPGGVGWVVLFCIWHWLEITHSAWLSWAGLEAPGEFYSMIRWPSISHVASPCSSFGFLTMWWFEGGQASCMEAGFQEGKKEKLPILWSLELTSAGTLQPST